MAKQAEASSKEIGWKDPEWTEDDLLWVLAWIDLVDKTNRPLSDEQELNQDILHGDGE
jgi:hypothetical protein